MPWDVQALGVAAVAAVAVPVVASLLKKAWYGWGLDLLLPFYRIDSEIRAFGRDKSTIQTLFRRQAQLRRNKPMVVCQGTVLTWHEMDTLSDTVSTFITTRCGKATAGGTSNTVAVMMVNSPEFVAVYLGAAKAGYTMSLLNPALRGKSLEHCIGQSKAKMMFVSSEVQHGCDVGEGTSCCGLDGVQCCPLSQEASVAHETTSEAGPPMLSYVFTSGTTGLPKACKITHLREAEGGIFFSRINGVVAEDRIFSPIGLHHSAGSLPLAMCLVTGATLVLSKSFSASGTIPACRESGATVLVYIGEMLRYIANSPVTPDDRNHSLRMLLGNGLRPDVWDRFVDRFGIEPSGVREYYSSTEGTITLVNVRGKPHAVGYLPPWASLVYRVPIIEVVDQNDDGGGRILGSSGGMLQPRRRGSDRLCIECTTGRVGEMLGPIDPSDPAAQFEGYAGNESATNSKIIHSVFRNGDTWFRSGDFLRRDANGFYFFCDRAGDTFRWRGENVATAEVEQTALRCPIVADCVCYGVATPHNDGKAGMLAVVFSSGTCGVEAAVSKLHDALAKDLPSYAVPTFLRVCVEIPTTPGTHKHQKATLVEQGFDPGKAPTESLFVRRGRGNTSRYEPLSHAEHALIVRGETRL